MKPCAVIAVALAFLSISAAACGGSSGGISTTAAPAITEPVALTTTFVPQAQVGGGTPAPKPTTTTTMPPIPEQFPADLPVPSGEVGYYTGSPELGFHYNISTQSTFSELVRFFTDAIEADPDWSIAVRDVGLGYLEGFTGQWAIYTAADHVLTQVQGEYEGVIEIEGRHVNILLDGLVQPAEGEELVVLPPADELPRPTTTRLSARYSSGLVQTEYEGGIPEFVALLAQYRELGWNELGVADPLEGNGAAVGEIGQWRIKMRDTGVSLELDFEDRSLSFP